MGLTDSCEIGQGGIFAAGFRCRLCSAGIEWDFAHNDVLGLAAFRSGGSFGIVYASQYHLSGFGCCMALFCRSFFSLACASAACHAYLEEWYWRQCFDDVQSSLASSSWPVVRQLHWHVGWSGGLHYRFLDVEAGKACMHFMGLVSIQ